MELGSLSRETLLEVALGLLVAVMLGQATITTIRRFFRRRAHSLRSLRAVAGEARAAPLLEAEGFTVLGAQVVAEHEVLVDDVPVRVTLRADYLVEREGARYVAEVKTGAVATRIETSATRRQVLEYLVAFGVEGVLLVDGDTGKIHTIRFPLLEREAPKRSAWPLVVVLAAAATVVVLLVR